MPQISAPPGVVRSTTRRAVLRTVLLGAQVALSATLLFGATLLTRGLMHAWNIDPGLFAAHGFGGQGHAAGAGVRCRARPRSFRTQLRDAFAAANLGPVGMADVVPLQPSALGSSVRRPQDAAADARRVHLRSYSAELFTLLKIPVVTGRLFDERHTGEVVVNESMARAFWPDSTAVGQRLIDGSRTVEVVGVVRDVAADRSRRGRAGDVHAADVPARYCRRFLMRSDVPPASDSRHRWPVGRARHGHHRAAGRDAAAGTERFVHRRHGQLDARRAGARPRRRRRVRRLQLSRRRADEGDRHPRSARRPARPGRCRAVRQPHARRCSPDWPSPRILSFAAGQALRGFLYGLSPLDPVAYVGTAAVLALAAVAATIIPARRAMTVDPVVALRHE